MKKLMNKKAFTIMEMLIVVAIIAVLVAIAIPTFSSALTKAKEATDVANVRAAYAELQVKVMVDNEGLPATQDAFISEYLSEGGNSVLNYSNGTGEATFSYELTENANAEDSATITYTPTKLNDKKPYTWTITGEKASA